MLVKSFCKKGSKLPLITSFTILLNNHNHNHNNLNYSHNNNKKKKNHNNNHNNNHSNNHNHNNNLAVIKNQIKTLVKINTKTFIHY